MGELSLQALGGGALQGRTLGGRHQPQHHARDRRADGVALQGGEVVAVVAVAVLRRAAVLPKALRERVGHLPLQRRELRRLPGVQWPALNGTGPVPQGRRPFAGGLGSGNLGAGSLGPRARRPLYGRRREGCWGRFRAVQAGFQRLATLPELAVFLPGQRGRPQWRLNRLALGGHRAPRQDVERASQGEVVRRRAVVRSGRGRRARKADRRGRLHFVEG